MSRAIDRYRGRMAERETILAALRIRREVLREAMGDLESDAHWRVKRAYVECDRVIAMIGNLPEPKRPVRRRRRPANVIQLRKVQ